MVQRSQIQPPSISTPGPCSDKRYAAFERAPKIMTKIIHSFFKVMSKVRSPGVIKGQIWPISTFFDKLAHNSGTRRATVLRKSAFDSPFKVILLACLQISTYVNGLAAISRYRAKTIKNSRFLRKTFFL